MLELMIVSYLEKVASGASSAYKHFVKNHAILRTFCVDYHILFTEDRGRRVDDGQLRIEKGDLG